MKTINVNAAKIPDGQGGWTPIPALGAPIDTTLSQAGYAADAKAVGDALDAQSDNITTLNNTIEEVETTISDAGKMLINLSFVDKAGYYNKDKNFATYTGISASQITVNEGDVYFLTSKNFYDMARVVFFDNSNTVISVIYNARDTDLVENTKIIVPVNAVSMMVQRYGTNDCTLYKSNLIEQISNITNDIEDLKDATTDFNSEDVELSFVEATGYYSSNKGFNTYSGVTVANVEVIEGQQFLLTTRNYYNAAIACLLDEDDTVVSVCYVGTGTDPVSDYLITIPNGISTLMIQRMYNYSPTKLEIITGIKAKEVNSILNGKRITVIGDSITERNLRAKTNWALWINDWCGAIIQNLGASGTGFIAGGSNPYSNRISSITDPDIIGVALSFNDINNTVEALSEAAEDFFDDLVTAYPTTPIICYVQSPWSAYHYGIEESDAWVNALREICWKKGIPFYDDMYKGSALKPWLSANRAVYFINDGEGSTGEEDWVHPNSEGHKIIARYLYTKFAENVVETGLDYIVNA